MTGVESELQGEQTRTVGRYWGAEEAEPSISWPARRARVERLAQEFLAHPERPFVLVGGTGIGKTWMLRALYERLRKEGWSVWEASASDLMAGMMYIGSLEMRLKLLITDLRPSAKCIWYCPDLLGLVHANASMANPDGAFDQIMPHLRRRQLCLIGELETQAWDSLIRSRPVLRNLIRLERIEGASRDDVVAILRERTVQLRSRRPDSRVSPDFAETLVDLSDRYLDHQDLPGRAMILLDATIAAEQEGEDGTAAQGPLTLDATALQQGLSRLTGLPDIIINESVPLDPRDLRQFFDKRVIGQPDAVECLVERIAMVKAGLTDPGRPMGVFLFAGPTGTGKTEVVKAMAQYLFGSTERMLRIDMSELQTPHSITRLIGIPGQRDDARSLVSQVRSEPFQVILLDEFEKAHYTTWDLFWSSMMDGLPMPMASSPISVTA